MVSLRPRKALRLLDQRLLQLREWLTALGVARDGPYYRPGESQLACLLCCIHFLDMSDPSAMTIVFMVSSVAAALPVFPAPVVAAFVSPPVAVPISAGPVGVVFVSLPVLAPV